MENKTNWICKEPKKFDWFCRGLLILLTAAIWYFFRQPMVEIPGMGALSAQETAGKLEIPIYVCLGLIVVFSLLGCKPMINLSVGGMAAFFVAVGLRALERVERILLEIEDDAIRATVNGSKPLLAAYLLASLILAIVILSLINRSWTCDRK